MTTKTELLEELKKSIDVIQQKIAEIEKEEGTKEQCNCLIKTPDPEDEYIYFLQDGNDVFCADFASSREVFSSSMHFSDEEQCKRYAEALTTFILLRKQPGSEVATDGIKQYVLFPDYNEVIVASYSCVNYKFSSISPCFKSEESARKAIEILGEERILNMFKYFHS